MNSINNIKVLFAHDGPILKDKHNYYGVSLNEKLRKRYLYLGNSVTFLTRVKDLKDDDIRKYSKIDNSNFNSIFVPNFKSLKLYFKNITNAKSIIEQAVLKHNILVARLPSAIGNIAVNYAIKYNKPFIVEFVACTFDTYWNYDWRGKIIALFKFILQRRIIKKTPYVIYVTKDFLQKRYPTKGKSINCSDVEISSIDNARLERRMIIIADLDINKGLTIGTVGSIAVKYKGQSDVIEAISKLKELGILVNYKLVGQGSEVSLKKVIKHFNVEDQVHIIGQIPSENILKFYEDIDLYIHPSRTEGLPRAVIEAMSTACPVIGSQVGGIPELIDLQCLFKPGAVHEIFTLLKDINKEWMIKQAKLNFNTAKEYSIETLTKRRIDFYDNFLIELGAVE